MDKKDILSLSLVQLEEEILLIGEKKFRAKQIFNWLHQKKVTSFDDMQNIPKDLRTKLNDNFKIYHLEAERTLKSKIDGTVKYLYRLEDGNHVETVLMDYSYGTSICVSTQVGCKMGCKFCASTIAGFRRNLEPSEILLQIYESERNSGKKISSVVLMGIGEPLDNFDNVLKFLELISSPEGNGLSLRHVTISTCGIVPKIKELAELKLGLTLAISLHASDNKSRSETMPINNRYHIEELISACKGYVSKTGRRITFEYALIDGVNSSHEDAKRLASLIRGINCHVNLIPVNKVAERNYSTHMKTVQSFKDSLDKLGINATIRRTLGSDINASCGQLRRNAENI
ncbi:MAG: 23S rRNA (adenine(2503)-C(2))-methyltransferase RlmN [Ruminococcus sp.]|nr:23S rRNA (adenine(2503)-C(2))-methyltransferase RlmN [Ruminococcus sp.]